MVILSELFLTGSCTVPKSLTSVCWEVEPVKSPTVVGPKRLAAGVVFLLVVRARQAERSSRESTHVLWQPADHKSGPAGAGGRGDGIRHVEGGGHDCTERE